MIPDHLAFALELAVLTLLYAGLRFAVFKWTKVSAEAYRSSFIAAALARRPWAVTGIVAVSAPLLGSSWASLSGGPWVRGYVGFLVVCACAFWSTYARNWYFDRRHLADRVLLVSLGLAALAHPVFVPLFVAESLLLARQFLFPLFPWDADDVNAYSHKIVVLHQLLGVVAFVAVQVVTAMPASRLFALALIIHGGNYVVSGVGKVRLSWAPHNNLRGLLVAGHAHGWFARGVHTRVLRSIERLRPVLTAGCVVLELGAGMLLADRALAVSVLAGLALMHVAILLLSGINFLAWSLLNVALLVVATLQPAEAFGLAPAVGVLCILVLGRGLLRPYELAWLDAPFCNAFRFIAVTTDHREAEIGPEAFAPLDMIVANGKYRFICEDRLLVDAWGETGSWEVVRELERVRTASELGELEGRLGHCAFKRQGRQAMRQFLQVFLDTAAKTPSRSGRSSWLARDWLSNRRTLARTTGDEPIAAISVRLSKTVLVDNTVRVLEDEEVLWVERHESDRSAARGAREAPYPRTGATTT